MHTTFHKLPLENLITILLNIYERGVEYIDISGEPNKEQDTIMISFSQDYMMEQKKTIEVAANKNIDEDLNQLI